MYGYGNMISPTNRIFGSGGATPNPLLSKLLVGYNADNNTNDVLGVNNATLINGATYGVGKINEAFSFDGVNDYATTGSRVGFSNNQNFTFSAWVKFNAVLNRGFFTNGDTSNGATMGTWNPGGGRKLSLLKGQGSAQSFANTTLNTGQWYHLVIVHTPYNGVSDNVFFYVNNVADGSDTFNIGTSTVDQNQYLGSKTDLGTYFNGLIDIAYIFDDSLSTDEISELYNGGTGLQL
jgi:hypothetical protein